MRVGISGTHGTGKTTLAQALCAQLPGHAVADEPYYLLEAEGYEFGFPPSPEDYRALLARSVRSMNSPPLLPGVVFDRTPLDYLAYMAATGADLPGEAGAAALRPAFASLDLLVITLITPETEQFLPTAELSRLRAEMNDSLLELVYDDPLNAWEDIPVLELSGPLDGRVDAVLAALDQIQRPRPGGPGINRLPPDLAGLNSRDATPHRSDSVERFTTGFLDAPKTSFEPLAPISQPRVVFPGNVIARP
jgi:predicted ATPase